MAVTKSPECDQVLLYLAQSLPHPVAERRTDKCNKSLRKVDERTMLQSVMVVHLSRVTGLHWIPVSTVTGDWVCDSSHSLAPQFSTRWSPASGLRDKDSRLAIRASSALSATYPYKQRLQRKLKGGGDLGTESRSLYNSSPPAMGGVT